MYSIPCNLLLLKPRNSLLRGPDLINSSYASAVPKNAVLQQRVPCTNSASLMFVGFCFVCAIWCLCFSRAIHWLAWLRYNFLPRSLESRLLWSRFRCFYIDRMIRVISGTVQQVVSFHMKGLLCIFWIFCLFFRNEGFPVYWLLYVWPGWMCTVQYQK